MNYNMNPKTIIELNEQQVEKLKLLLSQEIDENWSETNRTILRQILIKLENDEQK